MRPPDNRGGAIRRGHTAPGRPVPAKGDRDLDCRHATMTDTAHPHLTAVTRQRHAGRFWRRFRSYAFAQPLRGVDVVMAELEPAASAFPIVFRESGDDARFEPVALLRLAATGTTAFVARDGSWRGSYVPSRLRAHPFAAEPADTSGEMALMIDEDSGLVTDDPADEAFFDASGEPAEALAQVIAFFRSRARSAAAAADACTALRARDLMRPLRPLPGMRDEDAAGLFEVEADKLDALGHAALPALWDSGALRMAAAHRVSLCHAGWMDRAMRADAAARTAAPAPPDAPGAGIAGFLDALAEARGRDGGGE